MRVIVTGADRGVGLELVRKLRARGDTVDAACRRPGDATQLWATGARVHGVDVTSGTSVAAFAHALDGAAIDLVINNAEPLDSGPPRSKERNALPGKVPLAGAAMRAFETSALGALRIGQAFAPHLRRGSGKKLAHVSPLGPLDAPSGADDLAHRMSRTALHMIAKSLAAELHADRILSIVVHPGGASAPAESARGILAQIDGAVFVDSGAFQVIYSR